MRIQIEKLVQGGVGLGRHEGQVVFVPYTAPGETVEVTLRAQRSQYAEGVVQRILVRSPDRREPPCPLFGVCGGCHLQHLTEAAQQRYQTDVLVEALMRIGKWTQVPTPISVASPPLAYRRRVRLAVQNGRIGFYQHHTHQVVAVSHCPVLIPALDAALARLATALTPQTLRSLSAIELQAGAHPPEKVLVILTGKRALTREAEAFYQANASWVAGVVVESGRRQAWGQTALTYPFQERRLRVGARSFFQVNAAVNAEIIVRLIQQTRPEDTVLELYSGVGNFTLPLARRARAVTAVESHPHAMSDARHNLNRLQNVTLLKATAEAAVPQLTGPYTLVVLNPPREGAAPNVLAHLAHLQPQRILYLSCHPATLARDLARLCQGGYRLTYLWRFDMFPQTAHMEVLAALEREADVAKEGPHANSNEGSGVHSMDDPDLSLSMDR